MKFVVSSKDLHNYIRKAINSEVVRPRMVKVTPTELCIGKIKIPIASNEHVIYYSQFEFDKNLWIRILCFLRDIPEQPITCDFDDDHIDIYCVVRF